MAAFAACDSNNQVIDLLELSKSDLLHFYSQIRQVNDDCKLKENASMHLRSIKSSDRIALSPTAQRVVACYRSKWPLENIGRQIVGDLPIYSKNECLPIVVQLLVDAVFNDIPGLDLVPLMPSVGVTFKMVKEMREYLETSSDVSVADFLGSTLILPSMASLCLAFLYQQVPDSRLIRESKKMMSNSDFGVLMSDEQFKELFEQEWAKMESVRAEHREEHQKQLEKIDEEAQHLNQVIDDVEQRMREIQIGIDMYNKNQESIKAQHSKMVLEAPEINLIDDNRLTTSGSGDVGKKNLTDVVDIATVDDDEICVIVDEKKSSSHPSLKRHADSMSSTDSTTASAAATSFPSIKRVSLDLKTQQLSRSIAADVIPVCIDKTALSECTLTPYPPADLPELRETDACYAKWRQNARFYPAKLLKIMPSVVDSKSALYKIKFDEMSPHNLPLYKSDEIAFASPATWRFPVGTRVIAHFSMQEEMAGYYAGIVAEQPNSYTKFRYLIFFEDSDTQYVNFDQVLPMLHPPDPKRVWEVLESVELREFVRDYLSEFPDCRKVRLKVDNKVLVEYKGQWLNATVLEVDASLIKLAYEENNGTRRTEWIYRGSLRLWPLYQQKRNQEVAQKSNRRHNRQIEMPGRHSQANHVIEFVNVTHDHQQSRPPNSGTWSKKQTARKTTMLAAQMENRRQSAAASSSTAAPMMSLCVKWPSEEETQEITDWQAIENDLDCMIEIQDQIDPNSNNNAGVYHTHYRCTPKCIDRAAEGRLLAESREPRNPLTIPLRCGWQRQLGMFSRPGKSAKKKIDVTYVAPCCRRLRDLNELWSYLESTDSQLTVDLFCFDPEVQILYHMRAARSQAEARRNGCPRWVLQSMEDISRGQERVKIPVINIYDEKLPPVLDYQSFRSPSDSVILNDDGEFLSCCDCEDNCRDWSKCACQKLTLKHMSLIMDTNRQSYRMLYNGRRLSENLVSGVWECNSKCKCDKQRCQNRVVQFPLQRRLQVFKSQRRGWAVRTLDDIPKGAFICLYSGEILTDGGADAVGAREGDEYLAELDYIFVLEKRIKRIESGDLSSDDEDNDDDESNSNNSDDGDDGEEDEEEEEEDSDSQTTSAAAGKKKRKKRRIRYGMPPAKGKKKEKAAVGEKRKATTSRNKAGAAGAVSKKVVLDEDDLLKDSLLQHYGETECHILNAKRVGNVGRYLNHSCEPNCFAQNIFVDTHDLRFPWVAFFTNQVVKRGTELCWNYGYVIGAVDNIKMYCHCGTDSCRGRLL